MRQTSALIVSGLIAFVFLVIHYNEIRRSAYQLSAVVPMAVPYGMTLIMTLDSTIHTATDQVATGAIVGTAGEGIRIGRMARGSRVG